jgi:hypothetical protein
MPTARLLAALAALAPVFADAILIRADRDDAEYVEMASRYTASLGMGLPDGEGTLIAPRWILTSARVAADIASRKPWQLDARGGPYPVAQVFLHPDWKGDGANDIALVLLEREMDGIEPMPIYRNSDEKDESVVIVGRGLSGTLEKGPVAREKWDRRKRAAINTVDEVLPRTLVLIIKKPDEASDLQGAAAPGDSGAPAIIHDGKKLFVAGVWSGTDEANQGNRTGRVGDRERYARVSAFAKWIDDTMFRAAAQEAAAKPKK